MDQAENDAVELEPDKLSEIFEILREQGIELENLCGDPPAGAQVKVVCLDSGLGESFRELRKRPRGETVMVRIDQPTREKLDAWVETGHFKSRSEAAALFLKEGLRIRASELEGLEEALQQVKEARENLQAKARDVLGSDEPAD